MFIVGLGLTLMTMHEMSTILNTIRTCYIDTSVYLMGEFNLNLFDNSNNKKSMEYFKLISSFGFFPTVVRPTRVSYRSKTFIDKIWTNSINAIGNSGVFLSAITDIFPVFVCVKLNIVVPVYRSTYMVRRKTGLAMIISKNVFPLLIGKKFLMMLVLRPCKMPSMSSK